jgi:hypothetical protein
VSEKPKASNLMYISSIKKGLVSRWKQQFSTTKKTLQVGRLQTSVCHPSSLARMRIIVNFLPDLGIETFNQHRIEIRNPEVGTQEILLGISIDSFLVQDQTCPFSCQLPHASPLHDSSANEPFRSRCRHEHTSAFTYTFRLPGIPAPNFVAPPRHQAA